MRSGSLLSSIETPYPADVLLLWPNDRRLMVVGTYLLRENEEKTSSSDRIGKVMVYHVHRDEQWRIQPVQELDCPAILDLRWDPHNPSRLIAAHSTGNLTTYNVVADVLRLETCADSHAVDDSSTLLLQIAMDPVHSGQVLSSSSAGDLTMYDLNAESVVQTWNGHDLEAWTCTYDQGRPDMIWSGADDATIKCWDTRTPDMPVFVDRRTHEAGVTAILPNGTGEFMLTGSYDNQLRIFRQSVCAPKFSPRQETAKVDLVGGVWRLVPNPGNANRLLVCCMYEGARVVDWCVGKGDEDSLAVVSTFEGEHKSITYGCDWASEEVAATCSFYDKLICLWRV